MNQQQINGQIGKVCGCSFLLLFFGSHPRDGFGCVVQKDMNHEFGVSADVLILNATKMLGHGQA